MKLSAETKQRWTRRTEWGMRAVSVGLLILSIVLWLVAIYVADHEAAALLLRVTFGSVVLVALAWFCTRRSS